MKLQFSEKKEGRVYYLFMEGYLIGDEVGPRIAELVSDSVEAGIKTVVIDLEKVRYISSSGLGLLITLLTKMKNVGGLTFLNKFVVPILTKSSPITKRIKTVNRIL